MPIPKRTLKCRCLCTTKIKSNKTTLPTEKMPCTARVLLLVFERPKLCALDCACVPNSFQTPTLFVREKSGLLPCSLLKFSATELERNIPPFGFEREVAQKYSSRRFPSAPVQLIVRPCWDFLVRSWSPIFSIAARNISPVRCQFFRVICSGVVMN